MSETTSRAQIQVLREELDAANKKVDRYVNLVATLSEEIDNLRRGICHNCKKKFVPSYSPAASSPAKRGPSLWHRIVNGRQTDSPSSDLLAPVLPPDARESLTTPIPIHPVAAQNQAKSVIWVPPEAMTPKTTVDEIQSNWSYNPEIKQGLHMRLVKTSNFTAKVWCVKFSQDGKYLAIGDGSGKTSIFDVEKRSYICVLANHSLKMQPSIFDVQFSPDSQDVAVTGSDGRIRIWKIAGKRTISIFGGFSFTHNTSFSPDGRFLASTDTSGSICKWRIRDGYPKILISGVSVGLSVKFSPNGRNIASAHFNGLLMIWDARTNQLVHKWMGHTEPAYCLAFTPDGKVLVSGGSQGDEEITLKFWDVSSLVHSRSRRRPLIDGGMSSLRLEGHTQALRSVAVCPENRWIVTASEDRSVRIWDARTATWQCTLQAHTDYVCAVDFSPDGKYLASGGGDCVMLWEYRKA